MSFFSTLFGKPDPCSNALAEAIFAAHKRDIDLMRSSVERYVELSAMAQATAAAQPVAAAPRAEAPAAGFGFSMPRAA